MHDLTDEEQQLYDMVCEFADTVVAPQSYEADRTHTLVDGRRRPDGRTRPLRPAVPRGGTAARAATTWRCASRSRRSPASTSRSRSPSRPPSAWAPCRSTGTAPTSRRPSTCPTSSPAARSPGSASPSPRPGPTPAPPRTTAVLDGDEWVINGSKQFITNSGTPITRFVTVTAVTGERTRPDGSVSKELSTIIVPNGTPGFTVAPGYDKSGWRASDTHPLTFDDVRVPAANLLGERGRGFANFLRTLDEGRIAIAALATGVAQGCLDEALSYAKTRNVFGVPIALAPVRRLHHRPDAGPRLHRAPRLARRGPPGRCRDSRSRRRPRWPSSSRATPPCSTRAMPPRSSAAWAS